MRKKIITTIMALMVAAAAQAGTIPPEGKITIDGKRPVKFSHQTHLQLKIDCSACHHDNSGKGLNREAIGAMEEPALRCGTCHTAEFANQDLRKRKKIFHSTCRACHKRGYEGKNGPTRCVGCHTKKKRKAVEGC